MKGLWSCMLGFTDPVGLFSAYQETFRETSCLILQKVYKTWQWMAAPNGGFFLKFHLKKYFLVCIHHLFHMYSSFSGLTLEVFRSTFTWKMQHRQRCTVLFTCYFYYGLFFPTTNYHLELTNLFYFPLSSKIHHLMSQIPKLQLYHLFLSTHLSVSERAWCHMQH